MLDHSTCQTSFPVFWIGKWKYSIRCLAGRDDFSSPAVALPERSVSVSCQSLLLSTQGGCNTQVGKANFRASIPTLLSARPILGASSRAWGSCSKLRHTQAVRLPTDRGLTTTPQCEQERCVRKM